MPKKLKESSQMSPLAEYVEKNLHSPSYTEFIEGIIRSKIEGNSKSSLTYSKPYTPKIDSLKIPMGYQPLKFQQFDGKGNPKQHVAHFVETCNNAGTYGDHLVKQSVRSQKGHPLIGTLTWRPAQLIDGNN
ncbi:UNVERIFIED_CONTAM: hypothetical protein Sangu_1982100 [Sesamum angustifolium]|uniref:Ty3-gypsy retrotransposon protein n=1 Tax=Sesamum angustifolium TaxID=2727405 RepID=A0AAW2LXS4_9LAMI